MARVLILGDERKGRVRALVTATAEALRDSGHAVSVDLERETSLADREADLVAVFGGDGSILAAGRRMGSNQLPTLGVNLGRLGFLTAFSDEDALDGIEAALAGELFEEPRMMLRCRVQRPDGSVAADEVALNDIVVIREAGASMVTVAACCGELQLATYSGDGLIVATPSGSTAYSLSAGGPVLSPQLRALVLSPLAPHMLTLRPLVLPADDGLRLQIRETGGEPTCVLSFDGQLNVSIDPDDVVTLEPAAVPFRHVTTGPGTFFATLREKFGWADLPRRLQQGD